MKTCRVIVPPKGEACGKPATHVVTFLDGDTAEACQECAIGLQQSAQSVGASLKVERLSAQV
jgi:hypothetical protein